MFEGRTQGRTLAAIVRMRDDLESGVRLNLLENITRAVSGRIVDKDDLLVQAAGISGADAAQDLLDRVDFVEDRDQDR